MPEIPVLAYYYQKEEEELIRKYLRDPEWTDSFALGTIKTGDIPLLKKEGILMDILSDDYSPHREIPQKKQARALGAKLLSLGDDQGDHKEKPDSYLVSFKGPLLQPWKKKLEADAVEIREKLRENVYKVYTTQSIEHLKNLEFVISARPFETADTDVVVRRSLLPEFDLFEAENRRIAIYDIKSHQDKTEDIQRFLTDKKVDILAAGRDKIRIRLKGTELLAELRRMNGVIAIEEYVKPSLHNDKAREIINIVTLNNGDVQTSVPFEGEGQIIGVADTGIDAEHPDFEGRIHKIIARGRKDDASDPNGHGTHVSGSVVGNGNASDGVVKGIAPKAKLFFPISAG